MSSSIEIQRYKKSAVSSLDVSHALINNRVERAHEVRLLIHCASSSRKEIFDLSGLLLVSFILTLKIISFGSARRCSGYEEKKPKIFSFFAQSFLLIPQAQSECE